MSNLFIGLGLTTNDGTTSITDRPEVMALLNDVTWMRLDGDTGPLSSTKYLLASIKSEKPATFRFEWKPPEKYKNTFLNLKEKVQKTSSKPKFTLHLTFFYKDNGKIVWSLYAKANEATVFNVQKAGNDSNAFQTVDITCQDFDYK